MNKLIIDKGVFRTAPATRGLLNIRRPVGSERELLPLLSNTKDNVLGDW